MYVIVVSGAIFFVSFGQLGVQHDSLEAVVKLQP